MTGDGFASLCENMLRKFGRLPDGDAGTEAELTTAETTACQRETELSAIDDAAVRTRAEADKLLGISVASLDRSARRAESLGTVGVLTGALSVTCRGSRLRRHPIKLQSAETALCKFQNQNSGRLTSRFGRPDRRVCSFRDFEYRASTAELYLLTRALNRCRATRCTGSWS